MCVQMCQFLDSMKISTPNRCAPVVTSDFFCTSSVCDRKKTITLRPNQCVNGITLCAELILLGWKKTTTHILCARLINIRQRKTPSQCVWTRLCTIDTNQIKLKNIKQNRIDCMQYTVELLLVWKGNVQFSAAPITEYWCRKKNTTEKHKSEFMASVDTGESIKLEPN